MPMIPGRKEREEKIGAPVVTSKRGGNSLARRTTKARQA